MNKELLYSGQDRSAEFIARRYLLVAALVGGAAVVPHSAEREEPPHVVNIERTDLYTVPEEILQHVPYVTAVDEFNAETGKYTRGGTGTLIDGHVLTAGHVYEYEDSVTKGEPCEKMFVASRDLLPEPNRSNVSQVALSAVVALNTFRTSEDGSNYPDYSKPDIALFKADTPTGLPESVIAERQVSVGEVVTFTNYQRIVGRKQDELRHPMLDGDNGSHASYKGVTLGRVGERIAVMTDIPGTGFDMHGDTELTGGGSGGSVWNSKEQLVGISNNKNTKPLTVQEIREVYNVEIKNADPGQKFVISFMQPVERSDFKELEPAMQSCDFNYSAARRQPFAFEDAHEH